MAEAPDAEPVATTSEIVVVAPAPAPAAEAKQVEEDDAEPLAKRQKLYDASSDKLEYRLGGILCCAVCLDLPPAAVYQCCNGHLMCASCFTHLLADARLRDETHATCPNCRVEISKSSASRNLAVEKTVSELPSDCKYCTKVFPRHSLSHHEENTCEESASEYKLSQIVVSPNAEGARRYLADLVRIVAGIYSLLVASLRRSYLVSDPLAKPRRFRRLMGCRFACIGCTWRGPAHEAGGHEAACAHPGKSAADVVGALQEHEGAAAAAAALYTQMLDLLSYEKITFNDLQLKPYRTEDFMTKLYYESSRFAAFGHQWVVKAFVNRNQRDPTQSALREITYQLMVKSKPLDAVAVQWVVVRGPHGEARLRAAPRAHVYREEAPDAPPLPLPLLDPHDANRLLANKSIHFRLIMFQSPK